MNAGPAQRTFAVDKAFVFPLAQINDPRTPSNLVPACVKWVNDELDDLPSLSTLQPEADLGADADAVHEVSISALRALSAHSTSKVIRLAIVRDSETAGAPRSQEDADLWNRQESEALHHVIHTLDLFALTGDVSTSDEDIAHATVSLGGKSLEPSRRKRMGWSQFS